LYLLTFVCTEDMLIKY